MLLGMLALALQLQLVPAAARQAVPPHQARASATPDEDSLRDVGRARDAQAGFERGRRYVLPWASGSGGYCDVRVGRFCWWYDDGNTTRPAEPGEVARRRAELLRELDTLGARRRGDAWLAGMRVYYRVDNGEPALADSAARECGAVAWWCAALRAYAAQARHDVAAADSGFTAALEAMPDSARCAWSDITVLLPPGARDRYERLGCADRRATEARYWLLARPRLSVPANEWRSEFYARRVAASLLATATTPHRVPWGKDTEELLLRYGWPVSWARILPSSITTVEPEIVGYDPSPSFHYGPPEDLLDRDLSEPQVGWRLDDRHADTRYAAPGIRRVGEVRAALATFRRGDSTLITAVWETSDDSLARPVVSLGAVLADGRTHSAAVDSARRGHARLLVAGSPRLAGVELSDSATGALGFARTIFSSRPDSTAITLSGLLLYRPTSEGAPSLDEALPLAIADARIRLSEPVGLYWESYGADSAGGQAETSVYVERTDAGMFRGMRQRLGLADPDSPLVVRWTDARPSVDGASPRALSLDLSKLPAGHYRITVSVTPTVGMGASTSREVELVER